MVDISHDPRWGRTSEGFGEDMYLISIMDKAMVEVVQGKSSADCYSVIASVKRLAAYGAVKGGKRYNTADMSPQRPFNGHMPSHKVGLDAGDSTAIVVLNSLNGTSAIFDSWLLRDVLCDQWSLKGIAISGYDVVRELIEHGTAADPEGTVRVALKPGINMSMSDEYYLKYLLELIKSGKATMEELDDVARRALNIKYGMGLFNDPHSHLGPKESDPVDTNAKSRLHRREAHEVTCENLVLLRNRLETLPLKKSATTVVVGPLTDSERDVMGSWSVAGVADQLATVLARIKNVVGGGGKMSCAEGANVISGKGIVDLLN